MQTVHVLEIQPFVLKFFKPNSEDFVLFLDDSVNCPTLNNPHTTDKGRISVSAVCFDCRSFKGFFSDDGKKRIFCEGTYDLVNKFTPSIRDYLEHIEQPQELFWLKK